MSSSNDDNNPSETDVKSDAVEEAKSRASVSGDEKVSSSVNSSSIDSDEKGVSRVSVHVDENVVVDGDGSLVVDFRGSEEGRVSEGVVEVNEFRVCEIKNESVGEKLKEVSRNGFSEARSGRKEFDSGPGEDEKVQSFSEEIQVKSDTRNSGFGIKDHYVKDSGSEYDSMLSMFDQYAANGKSEAVGYGYEIGDMVWGKVKSHPWWPGHIFNDAFASSSVRRTKRAGHVLVAFFGDSSYGWFDPAELIPFEPNFAEKSRQTNSRTFMKSVEEALEELNRRQALGLVCNCRNQFNFRHTDAEGYLAVDVGDYEQGFYSVSQIKKARADFHPRAMLDFVRQLALAPMSDDFGTINLMKNKATVSALRKAVFEEYDETYAQAFGAQPVRSVVQSAPIEPSRVPLSGRQVFAETLGKGKSSLKPNKMKDQIEKDKYLFKRRDEPKESKAHKIIRGQTSTQLPQRVGSILPTKGMPPAAVDHGSQTSVSRVAQVLEQSVGEPATLGELSEKEQVQDYVTGNYLSGVTEAKFTAEGTKQKNDSGKKKAKRNKHPAGELGLDGSVPVEKIKKRKKEIGKQSIVDHSLTPGIVGKGGALAGQTDGKPVDVPSVLGDDSIAGKGGTSVGQVVGPVELPLVPGDNSHGKHLGNDDSDRTVMLPDFGTNPVVADKNVQLELPQLLDDLRALALNPFLSSESNYPANLVQVFVRFRSLVYQKSLSLLASGENELKEVRGILPSPSASFDNPRDNLKELSSVRPPKPPLRLEDPTKGGRKRGPSDRQEEMILKKKKKIHDLKLLTTEKKATQRAPEFQRGDGREMSAKTMAQTPEKKAALKLPEVQVGDGRERTGKPVPSVPGKVSRSESVKKRQSPAKAAEPTMLVMKFPPEAALPSPAELKVKFARFGPLDHSGTRIFWKSSTIRLVYFHKNHAQAALKFATSSSNLFGNTNVRCHLRDLGVETPETESTKVEPNIGISQSKDPPVLQQRLATNIVSQPLSQPGHLKSCLKKPPGDEGTSTAGGNGNGNSRGRVKFMLGDEGSVRTSSDDGASFHGLNFNSEKIQMDVLPPPPPSIIPQQFPIAPNNYHHHTELVSRNVQSFSTAAQPLPTRIDISQQMISLLTKCKDVVNNLTGALGYVPYHPL